MPLPLRTLFFALILPALIGSSCTFKKAAAPPAAQNLRIVVSTFPLYLFTKNITAGRTGISVSLLLPAALGCPHDYALRPKDLQQLAAADVFIVNGLGMEEFLGAPLEKVNPHIRMLTATEGMDSLLSFADLLGAEGADAHESDTHDDAAEEHIHAGFNPHLFASPRQAARMVRSMAEKLALIDTAGASVYRSNALRYAESLDTLASAFSAAAAGLANPRIVAQHGVLDYFARDAGLTVSAVLQAHPGEDVSAAQLLKLSQLLKKTAPAVILVEPQYPSKIAESLSRQTGVPVAIFDPAASGPDSAALDYYETVMHSNIAMFATLPRGVAP